MLLQMAEFHSIYGWLIFHCVCVCVCHIFLIYSSVDGQLGWFHILAIVSNAAVNIVFSILTFTVANTNTVTTHSKICAVVTIENVAYVSGIT